MGLLIGADAATSPLHDDFALPADRPGVAALFVLAENRRQDLRAAALAAESARAQVEVAFGQYYPSLEVNLDWFLSRESLPTDRAWSGLLTLDLPLFSAGRIHADVREAFFEIVKAAIETYDMLDDRMRRRLLKPGRN